MNKFLKWILAGLGIIVVLLVIAAVVLPLVIDPNDYKEEIRTAVKENTGRELSIAGDIEWTVFPSIGLGLSDLELGNRKGFGDQPMLQIGEAGLSVKLRPLFSRKVEIGQVSLSDVSAYLQRKANGQTNWDDLGGESSADTTSSSSGEELAAITVEGIDISNANVTWDDEGQITELKDFNLKASGIELGRPFTLEGGFSVAISESQLLGEAKFEGLVSSRADGSRYGIEGLEFTFKGTQGPADESMSLDMAVNANAEVNLDQDQASLSDFIFQFHDLKIEGALDVTSLSGNPELAGQLSVPEFNPRSFLEALGAEAPQTSDPAALTSLQAQMLFAGSSSRADMKNLDVKFDKSTFKGNLKIDNFDAPKLGFNLQIDSLNLDEYLPPTATEGSSESSPAQAETDLTVDTFRGFTGGGDFRIGALTLAGITATEVSLKMTSNGNGVRLFPIKARFYEGQYRGDVRINAGGKRPILTADEKITGFRAEAVLAALTGSSRLEGAGDFNLKIRTDLTNSQTTLQDLSGGFALNFLDGAIVGIDVAETIRKAKSALGKSDGSAANTDRDPKTDFTELSMTGNIQQGVITSDDLMMRSPLMRVTGKGTINLVEESIDYRVKPVLTSNLDGQDSQELGELKGVPIPVRLSGNLFEPDISVDIIAAITGSQKEALMGKLLGSDSDAGTDGETAEDADPAGALIDSVFGKKKEKKKNKNKNKQKKEDGEG